MTDHSHSNSSGKPYASPQVSQFDFVEQKVLSHERGKAAPPSSTHSHYQEPAFYGPGGCVGREGGREGRKEGRGEEKEKKEGGCNISAFSQVFQLGHHLLESSKVM